MEGWITLNRSLMDNFIWHGEPFTRGQAWVDLLLLANHAPTRTMIDGKVIDLEPGSYVTSIRRLADRWERSPKWTMKFLDLLESDNMIETRIVGNGNAKRTVLFIVKYGIYQASYVDEETQRKRSGTHKGNAKETQIGGKGVISNNIYNNIINNETMEQYNTTIAREPRHDYSAEFEEVWKLYPNKKGKPNALRDYSKARAEGISRETIEDGIRNYIAECKRLGTQSQYIAHGSTWFHQRRWEDEYSDDEPYAKQDDLDFDVAAYAEQMKREGLL